MSRVLAIGTLLTGALALAAPPATVKLGEQIQALGEATIADGVVTGKAVKSTILIGPADGDVYRVNAELKLVDRVAGNSIQVMPSEPSDFQKSAALHATFTRDAAGVNLQASTYAWDGAANKWGSGGDAAWHYYWPADYDKRRLALVEGSGLKPRNLKDRWLKLCVEADRRHVAFYIDGWLIRQVDRPAGTKGPVALQLNTGDQLRNITYAPVVESLFLPVDLSQNAHAPLPQPIGRSSLTLRGVPFDLAEGGKAVVDLRKAGWIEQKTDPADYYENYEAGPPVIHDPRMPFVRVPLADYTAAHLLAVADDDPNTTPNFTLRAGRYGYSEQVVFHSFPGTAPRVKEAGKTDAASQLPGGPFFHVQVPMQRAIAQDLDRWLEIELTKEIRLARRVPDPCRFRSRPLGLPSGVRIAALTLEKSPLQMRVTSKEVGHAFVEPSKPTFQISLTNITGKEQPYDLSLTLTALDGVTLRESKQGTVPAGQSVEVELAAPARRGYHDAAVTLRDGAGKILLERRTSCCLLPPDTRKHRDKAPWGTWDFCGGHFTVSDPEITGPLYVKLGLRHGMFSIPAEKRKKWGILAGHEPNIYDGGLKLFEDYLKRHPDSPRVGLIFHETAVNGQQVTRVPDLFHAGPELKFNAADEKKLQELIEKATRSAREIKAKYPDAHLRIGNGTLPMKETLYRAKFPRELFDSAGNEAGCFGRLPEAQPPDCVALNASLWMDRRLLDHYGYKEKAVTMCVETGYPATSPGNLSMRDQADYMVRHGLHALAWGMPEIKLGQICDMGNGYYFSNWGAIGFVHSKPELNVKPSFVSFATMTRVLDGAKYVRTVPLGSPSLHGIEFDRPDGQQVLALWTLRGQRPLRLTFDNAGPWTLINDQGEEKALMAVNGAVSVTLTPSPLWIVGKSRVVKVQAGESTYAEKPPAKAAVLSPLASLDDWTVETERDPELEIYEFMNPRRKGDFEFATVRANSPRSPYLQVTPRPIQHGKETMPMYVALRHKQGIPVPGTPTEIGTWVQGNSGWGRLIYELTDATGQRWISIGAEQPGIPPEWVTDLTPPELRGKWAKPAINDWNCSDVFGWSRINFDGWRYVAFPLPGNFPGEKHHWSANSQWRWDKDGVVHYPLTFRRLIIELPEKVLHVKEFAPPPSIAIGIKDLTAGQDDRQLGYVVGPDR